MAESLATAVYDKLRSSLDVLVAEGLDVQTARPGTIPAVAGSTPEKRAKAVGELARRTGADVIVYGDVRLADGASFQPELFLTDRTLVGSEELAGHHDIGAALRVQGDFARNPVARQLLREQVVGPATAFADLVVGLGYYAEERLPAAVEHLRLAAAAPGWDETEGKEVLHLFLGNVALKELDFATASQEYDRALALNPEYARARLGEAEVQFQQARGDCEAGNLNPLGMVAALDGFASAAAARGQPPISHVPVRAIFGRARVYACLTQAVVADHTAEAEDGFRRVLAAYRETGEPLRELAAESHAGLGFLALPDASATDRPSRYRTALGEYQQALDLTRRNDRKAFFASMTGFVYGRLSERDKADAAYRDAIRLGTDPEARQQWENTRVALRQGS